VTWAQLLDLLRRACAEQGELRRVLLVLADSRHHVKEVLSTDAVERGLLGFVVWQDDPTGSARTEETKLLFVRPDAVLRLEVEGQPHDATRGFGFR
jgi:hypothetical protein